MAKATRQAYGEKLAELVAENPKIVVLDADLAGSTKSGEAKKVAPERFFDFGIAEADMIGHAAGFAASGYTPLRQALRCSQADAPGNRSATVWPTRS